jgi:gliding motility associated protien GldN
MKFVKEGLLVGALIAGASITGTAQEVDTRGYNPNSVRPIHESHVMFKRTVWQNLDMKEKQNRPFMARGNEITRFIFNAVKQGLLQPYTDDSLTKKMPVEEFVQNISATGTTMTEEEKKFEIQRIKDDDFLTAAEKQQRIADLNKGGGAQEFDPSFFTQIELREDWLFDKVRSRLYYDIQSLTIFLPAERNGETGIDKRVASFKYIDLAKLFKSSPNAVWFNALNNQEHKNLSDAFDLRLFASRIIKVSNPDDNSLNDVYGEGKKGLMASEWARQQLMEFEHNLWEF